MAAAVNRQAAALDVLPVVPSVVVHSKALALNAVQSLVFWPFAVWHLAGALLAFESEFAVVSTFNLHSSWASSCLSWVTCATAAAYAVVNVALSAVAPLAATAATGATGATAVTSATPAPISAGTPTTSTTSTTWTTSAPRSVAA